MKLLIDTNWFAMIQDLPYRKQKDVLCAILDYPNRDSDTNLWKKVIKPALEKEKNIYENKCENLKQANTQKTKKKITDSDTDSYTDSDTDSYSNSKSNNNIYNIYNIQDNNKLSGIKEEIKKETTKEKNNEEDTFCNKNSEDRTLEIQFNTFWEVFPKQRKAGKTKPRQKFYQIVKSKQATAEQLIKAAEDYAKSDTVIRGYAKEPYSWLLNERYLCDYTTQIRPMPQMSLKEMKQMQNEIELEKIRRGEK